MGEFYIRAWQEQVLFDCRDYIVKADDLEWAVAKLETAQILVSEEGHPLKIEDICLVNPINQMKENVVIALDPKEIVYNASGYIELTADGRRKRDLTEDIPLNCVRRGEPLDWHVEETITNEDDHVVEEICVDDEDEGEFIDIADTTKMGTTERGFDRIEFKDVNGKDCSLQKSSVATEDCIWLGCNDIGLMRFDQNAGGWTEVPLEQNGHYGVHHIANTRMHLNGEQVAVILPFLQQFVETGELTQRLVDDGVDKN